MSSFHNVLYARLSFSRKATIDRLSPVLGVHGVWFLHSARGLRWRGETNDYSPDIDQELDHVGPFLDAVNETSDWECVCFDFRFLQWSFELYLFDGRSESIGTNLLLSFPHSLYKFSIRDPVIAARWLGLMADIGLAIDNSAMICGLDVLMIDGSENRLVSRFRHFMETAPRESYAIHTACLNHGELHQEADIAGFITASLNDSYRLTTKLCYDREVLLASMGAV